MFLIKIVTLKTLKKKIKFVKLRHSRRFSYVQVLKKPDGWECAGTGNSAAVFHNGDCPDVAVKVFSDACQHIACEESEVYRKLGDFFSYPRFYGSGENFLIMQYIPGISAYECLLKGRYIPERVVHDIDEAVLYARRKGLNPRNIHAKNILIHNGRGYVVDVSEYMKRGKCFHWDILRYVYHNLYRRYFKPGMKIPFWVLEYIRRGYRVLKLEGVIKRK